MAELVMDPNIDYIRPSKDPDWEHWRPLIQQLWIDEDKPLFQVRKTLMEKYRFFASEKMYKSRLKHWGMRKYLTENEAQQIVAGDVSAAGTAIRPACDPEQAKKKAARSLARKRARERARTLQQQNPQGSSPASPSPSSPGDGSLVLYGTPAPTETFSLSPLNGFQLNVGVTEQFLFNLRNWTHDAYISGHWDTKSSAEHQSGRRASRLLSSHLTAGINLHDNGKVPLAWKQWQRARASFENPNLFKSWYHNIPMALLFEVGRVVHSGHAGFAEMLLKWIKSWATNYLDTNDSRYVLFSQFGDLDVAELRDLYWRAARCMYNGVESRVEKNNKILYEVRLNRALDMLWYDAEADLTEWLPPMAEVDEACGRNNPYSVYFLLLEAYRLVARDAYPEAEDVCGQVKERLSAIEESGGGIDLWRVGLAYRRLGRLQHAKRRFAEARRSFNTALKYVSHDKQLSSSVLIEICQRQQSMANEVHDQEDGVFWNLMLSQLEAKAQAEDEDLGPVEEQAVVVSNQKRRQIDQPSTLTRSYTL